MKKLVIMLFVFLLVLTGFLSGCNQQSASSNNENDESVLTKTYDTVDEMMVAIYKESLDFRATVTNIANTFKLESDIVNYDSSQFEIHKEQLNSHDISTFDRFGEYKEARSHLINGLNYITKKDYENAWSSILYADDAVWYISQYTGYSVIQDFGLEDLMHLLYELK